MQIRYKGNKYELNYRINGYDKVFSERFDTEVEANHRAAEIELARANGTLRPPAKGEKKRALTLSEYLDEFVTNYGSTHWGDSYMSETIRQIRDYIKPSRIGSLLLRDVTAKDISDFYVDLLDTTAVITKGHKDTGKKVGASVIEKIHSVLKSAYNVAIRWQYVTANPVLSATLPALTHKKRDVWTPEIAAKALDACNDIVLKVSLLLAIGCSMRIGEITGLQWSNVIVTPETIKSGDSRLYVKQELKRCDKFALEKMKGRKKEEIFFVFPELKEGCKTSVVLKAPKTESSVRVIYLPKTVADELVKLKAWHEHNKALFKDEYSDFDLVIAQSNGRPVEAHVMEDRLQKLIDSEGLPDVVFHSTRHLSTSVKLKLSGGDIKTVQGDTGHSQSRMVTEVYSEIFDDDRKLLAKKMDRDFFRGGSNVIDTPDEKRAQVDELLEKNPELMDMLILLSKKVG